MKKIVVSAPSLFKSSGGITILHKLVNTLNELGYDSYIAPSAPSGLGWHPNHIQFNVSEKYKNIKLITQEVYDNLDDAIVVYPETWYGNYLKAPNVVRWIMGPANPSYMGAGNLYGMNYDAWSEKDLWFWYTPLYKTKNFNSFNRDFNNNLTLIEFNREIFINRNENRNLNCWTLRKSTGKISPDQYIHSSSDLFFGDIDKSLPNPDFDFPGNYRKLSDIFNKSNRFYSYDAYTFINVQAVMCGCDSIVAPMPGLDKTEYYSGLEFHKYIAYGLDEIDNAKSVRNELNDHITDFENKSIKQIHRFVEKCNDYFK